MQRSLSAAFSRNAQNASRATPTQTKRAAVQRRRSTFSWRKNFAARALVTKVRDVAAGPMRLRSRWLKANSKEKKLRARQMTPRPNRSVGDDGCGGAEESAALADHVEVADLAHGGGGENVAGGRGHDDAGDHGAGGKDGGGHRRASSGFRTRGLKPTSFWCGCRHD